MPYMSPSQLDEWSKANGGATARDLGNGTVEYVAGNGSRLVVQRSGDGYGVVDHVLPNGQSGMSAPASNASSGAPAAAPQGASPEQQRLQALLSQFSGGNPTGLSFTQESKQEEIPNPAAYDENGQRNAGVPLTTKGTVWYGTWVRPGTRQRLTVKMTPQGTYETVFQGEDPDIKPDQQQQAKPVRSYTGTDPQTGRPATVTEHSDGSKTYEEIKPGTKHAVRSYTGVDPQTNKPANVTQYDDGSLTYEEVKPGQTARKPIRSYTGVDPQTNKPATVTEYDDGGKTYEEVKPGARQAVREYTGVDPQTNKPAKVTEYSDGSKTYAEVDPRQQNKYVRLEQDKDSGKWFGLTPDGKWEEVPGGPGTTPPSTSRGPSMPQMIVGQSQQALRQYADDLNGQVASGQMTVAERDKRWAEAVQTATFAYNEATLLENARQSDQSAAVSLSNNRLSNSMSGFNTALQVVANLNDKLQPGSNLGGKAFAALLDLQVMQAHRMGAFDAGPTPQMRPSALPGQGGAGASAATAGGAPSPAGAPSTSTSPSPSAQPVAAPAAAASPAASLATPAAAPTVPPGMEPRAAQGARWFNDPKTGEVRWITPDGDIHAVNPDGTTSVIATPANAQENRAIYDAANPPGSPPPSAASTPAGSCRSEPGPGCCSGLYPCRLAALARRQGRRQRYGHHQERQRRHDAGSPRHGGRGSRAVFGRPRARRLPRRGRPPGGHPTRSGGSGGVPSHHPAVLAGSRRLAHDRVGHAGALQPRHRPVDPDGAGSTRRLGGPGQDAPAGRSHRGGAREPAPGTPRLRRPEGLRAAGSTRSRGSHARPDRSAAGRAPRHRSEPPAVAAEPRYVCAHEGGRRA
jgi:hypothetical protein